MAPTSLVLLRKRRSGHAPARRDGPAEVSWLGLRGRPGTTASGQAVYLHDLWIDQRSLGVERVEIRAADRATDFRAILPVRSVSFDARSPSHQPPSDRSPSHQGAAPVCFELTVHDDELLMFEMASSPSDRAAWRSGRTPALPPPTLETLRRYTSIVGDSGRIGTVVDATIDLRAWRLTTLLASAPWWRLRRRVEIVRDDVASIDWLERAVRLKSRAARGG